MKSLNFEFVLSDENIDIASEKISTFFDEIKIDRKELMRLKLSAENALINWQAKLGRGTRVVMSCTTRFGDYNVIFECDGDECNPLNVEDEIGAWAKSMQDNFRTAPSFDYFHRKNTVRFVIKRKHVSRVLQCVIWLVLGIILGAVGMSFSDSFKTFACDNVFTPLYETYLNVFGLCGIPLIFLSMVTGILGVGDIHSFSIIGKKMVLMFLGILGVTAILAILIGLPFFSFTFGESGASFQFESFLDMALGWLPTGLFQPFINCDAMQLIILGAGFGIAILVLNGCSGSLVNAFYDVNNILLRFCRWLACLIPPFVCIMIIKSMWSSEMSQIFATWKNWVITVALQLVFLAVLILWLVYKYKANLKVVVKKISKTFLIALGTNSCTVSVPENYSACASLGISPKVFSFGIPIGTSIFKPATAIRLVLLSLFMASTTGVTVSFGWFVMVLILSVVLSIAIPAIPGGCLMFCTMLFTRLNISAEVLTQVLATDVFFDAICTAVNQVSVTLGLSVYGGSVGLIDEGKLKK